MEPKQEACGCSGSDRMPTHGAPGLNPAGSTNSARAFAGGRPNPRALPTPCSGSSNTLNPLSKEQSNSGNPAAAPPPSGESPAHAAHLLVRVDTSPDSHTQPWESTHSCRDPSYTSTWPGILRGNNKTSIYPILERFGWEGTRKLISSH